MEKSKNKKKIPTTDNQQIPQPQPGIMPTGYEISLENLNKFGETLNLAIPNEYIRKGVYSAINDLFTPILPKEE